MVFPVDSCVRVREPVGCAICMHRLAVLTHFDVPVCTVNYATQVGVSANVVAFWLNCTHRCLLARMRIV